ncbi:MAG TPA: UDP-glucose/GDP-mannose dehydrogenase family protein [Candidatus Limnocylindrales bacterium]|nr:UDP-glucose/GDP-mannose dehydrogenase family protein [Candidatus Limnocylindrales bacterium]
MRVSIVGTGYVGLVTGACLAEAGHDVICVDTNLERVTMVNEAKPPFHEPGLPELLASVSLIGTLDLEMAVRESDLTMIAVGTPFDGTQIDLSYVESVSAQIGMALKEKDGYHVVVVKSTVVPGTTEKLVLPLLEKHSGKRAGAGFGVGMNPEFLSEGSALRDARRPDRIVLGGIDPRTLGAMAALYEPWHETPVLMVSPAAAEMIKYASNALQAMLISFANEMANLAATVEGVDIVEVERGLHLSELIRDAPVVSFLKSGCGFGGSCFPKDLAALAAFGAAQGVPMDIASAVLSVNRSQPARLVSLLGDVLGKRVAVLGISFKPGTDDIRESPAIDIISLLLERGAEVVAYDPIAVAPDVPHASTLDDSLDGADAVVLVTAWPEFAAVPEKLAGRSIPVADGRRLWSPEAFVDYRALGRTLP